MPMNPQLEAAVEQSAWRAGVDANELRRAIETHDGARLAALLGVDPQAASTVLARLERAWTFEADAGAGCQLLTDDIADEVAQTLGELAALAASRRSSTSSPAVQRRADTPRRNK